MQSRRGGMRRRGRARGRPPTKTLIPVQQPTSITSNSEMSDPSAHVTTDQEPSAPPINPRYELRPNRARRYRCRTCGLRDCNLLINGNDQPKPLVLAVNESTNSLMVHRLVIRAEKTYTGVKRSQSFSIEHIMAKVSESEVTRAPCPRFKEWTHDHYGLQFTLPITIPPTPPNIAIGSFNYKREPVQMIRCITADLLHDKYGIIARAGDVYQPIRHWWLLITANRVSDLVHPNSLCSCLENLRTTATSDLIICFHIIPIIRGKVKFQWWFELLISIFAQFPRIRILDDWTHAFSPPVAIPSALSDLEV